jgi:hypothetical protein
MTQQELGLTGVGEAKPAERMIINYAALLELERINNVLCRATEADRLEAAAMLTDFFDSVQVRRFPTDAA